MNVRNFFGLFKEAGKDFMSDSAPRLGASIAYYTIFSLSPLFIIAIAVASLVFGAEAARGQLYDQISGLVGPKGAEAVQSLISQPENQRHGVMATVIAGITLLLGSTGVFMELQAALNTVWDVKQAPGSGGGVWGFIKHRLLSFAMVLTVGFLLLVSLILTAAIGAMTSYMGSRIPNFEALSQALNFVTSFGIITILFAFIFKFMPDVRIPWKIVWIGAAFTSLLFTVGKLGLGLYLAKSTAANAFGAAGSLVVLLLWVYYSAQILFFGAELTQAYAKQRGIKVAPKQHAAANQEESSKEISPTQDADSPSKSPSGARPVPSARPPAHKPGFVVPAIVVLLALLIPKGRKQHS